MKMPSMKTNTILRILESNGWELQRTSGTHRIFKKEGMRTISVACHKNKEIGGPIIAKIFKEAGIVYSP